MLSEDEDWISDRVTETVPLMDMLLPIISEVDEELDGSIEDGTTPVSKRGGAETALGI